MYVRRFGVIVIFGDTDDRDWRDPPPSVSLVRTWTGVATFRGAGVMDTSRSLFIDSSNAECTALSGLASRPAGDNSEGTVEAVGDNLGSKSATFVNSSSMRPASIAGGGGGSGANETGVMCCVAVVTNDGLGRLELG
jgi:hypothetical protein